MGPKIAHNCKHLAGFVTGQFGRLYACVISGFSSDNLVARAFMMIALGVPAGTTLWTLAAAAILHKTQR
jgi:hypothetical protein